MNEYTEFGLVVKTKLLGPPARTSTWLRHEVEKDTGLKVDSSYMSRILTGQRNPEKIIKSICKILKIDYEQCTTP